MKKIVKILLLILGFIPESIHASHIFATNITCTYSGTPNTYYVTYKMYRDCSGIPAPTQVPICYSSLSLGLNGSTDLFPIFGTGQEVTLGPCYSPGSVTSCNGGTAVGLQEYVYAGTVVLPAAATDWIFGYAECCHTPNITNLANPGAGAYIYTSLDNLNYPTNSTPDFLQPAWAQYCIGSPAVHEFTATDVDGDSLVYSFDYCKDAGSGCPYTAFNLQYLPPYTINSPMASSSSIVLDPANGEMSFTPNLIQYAEVAIKLSEYRNGQLISVTHREDLIASINGVLGQDDVLGNVYHDLNANSVRDAGEPGMNGQLIEITPGPYYFSTNALGDYVAQVPVNNYTVKVRNNYPWFYSSPQSHAANFTAFGQTDSGNDFGFGAYISLQNLRVVATGNNVRPGVASSIYITATNMGTLTTNATVTLTLDPSLLYINALPAPASVSGNVLTWNIPGMQMLQMENFEVSVDVANLPIGTQLNCVAEIMPLSGDSLPDDNIDSLNLTLVNSCDPNEKKVFPDDYITTTQIDNGLYLDYTVFFQNVGNAPAINVHIVDTLDQNFEIGSFEMVSASHPYTWSMKGKGILNFTFAGINLPDSTANEIASHGFIRYRAKPKNNLFNGEKLTNYAYIYFDNNASIQTNYTSTHVFNTTGITEEDHDKMMFVYPNPADKILTIKNLDENNEIIRISIFSVLGQNVFEENNQGFKSERVVDVSELNAGMYSLKIETAKYIIVKKVLIE